VSVRILEVSKAKEKKIFSQLPYRLHSRHPGWIPPPRPMERNYINPRKNLHMTHADTLCLLSHTDGLPSGRIMGLINHELREVEEKRQARFCSFESINDEQTASGLLSAVEAWAKKRGMVKIIGPIGFTNQDPQGFIIEGFEQRPALNTIHNFDHVPALLEKAGYSKELDYLTYKIPIPEKAPDLYYRLAPRVLQRNKVTLLEFKKKNQAKIYLPKMLRLMNETYRNLYGFVVLGDQEIERRTATYLRIMTPEFFKILLDEKGEAVAFIFGIRDITEGIRAAGGRLFPLGYLKIRYKQKRARRLDLLLGAVKEEYQGRGLDVMMALAMLKSAQASGIEYADSHHEAESNTLVQAEMKRMGGFVYKRHRIYQKAL
jgi:ribosomal protein S18 acetylase RimI-like enzyme